MERDYQYDQKVVVLGGGTGPFNLLAGLVEHNNPKKVTSVYTTWDSGESSGRLRTEYGVLPMGDARRQLAACKMDDEYSEGGEPSLKEVILRLFDSRVDGHAVGNLMITALDQAYNGQGIKQLGRLFGINAKIIPVSRYDLTLGHKDESGRETLGEHELDVRKHKDNFDPNNRISSVFFTTKPRVNPVATEAIQQADRIVLSPGSLFGSVIPHLLVPGIRETIIESKGKLVFVLNIMTEVGQTDGYKASDHLAHVLRALKDPCRLDFMIAHNNHIDPEILEYYRGEKQIPVDVDVENCKKLAPRMRIFEGKLARFVDYEHLLRHDPDKTALGCLDPEKYLHETA